MNNTLEYSNAQEFMHLGRIYRFPFVAKSNEFGRIEWCIELVKSNRKKSGAYHINGLFVWAKQTPDERYKNRVFQIPCYSEMLHSDPLPTGENEFLKHVWSVGFCELHGNIYLTAYPKNFHTELVIQPNSSVMIEATFL